MASAKVFPSFNSGEWSKLLNGRVDLEGYPKALSQSTSGYLYPQGPWQFCPGSEYIATYAASVYNGDKIRIEKFDVSTTTSYVVVFRFNTTSSAIEVRVFAPDGTSKLAATTLYATATSADFDALTMVQTVGVMYISAPGLTVKKLLRISDTTWLISANFTSPAVISMVHDYDIGLTGSSPAITGMSAGYGTAGATPITVTASAQTFAQADVGRLLRAGSGLAKVLTLVSGTQITVTIIYGFNSATYAYNEWQLEGSPSTSITPSAIASVGATITLNSGAVSCWRSQDINKTISIHGGYLLINGFTSIYIVSAVAIVATTSAAATTSWTMYKPLFNDNYGYPHAMTLHQDRLCWFGNNKHPDTFALSESGNWESFMPGANDSNAITATLNSSEIEPIQWAASQGATLLIGTDNGEWAIQAANGVLTPSDISANRQSSVGGSNIQPVMVGQSVVFTQKLRRTMHELTYEFANSGYVPTDINTYATHICEPTNDRIVQVAYQRVPHPIIWGVTESGKLISCSFNRGQGIAAWSTRPAPTGVMFRSVCVISDSTGEKENAYVACDLIVAGVRVFYLAKVSDLFESGNLADANHIDLKQTATLAADGSFTLATLADQGVRVMDATTGRWWADTTLDSTGAGNVGETVTTKKFTKIACGDNHTIALRDDGTLWAWGKNDYGQLGLGDLVYRDKPVQIGTDTDWSDIACGGEFSLALKSTGTMWAWGRNNTYQLGLGNTTDQHSPIQVGVATNWSTIACGAFHAFAIKSTGTLWSWGVNSSYVTAQGTTAGATATPTQVGVLTTWSKVACGGGCTVAIKTDGTMWSVGANAHGATGQGVATGATATLTQIGVATTWSKISSGSFAHCMAIKTDGTLWAWGYNAYGQLGDGTTTRRTSPVQIGALTTWDKISCGEWHSVAVKTDDTLWTCGLNSYGQLGQGDTTNRTSLTQVGALTVWGPIGAGYQHTVVAKDPTASDGTLWACGNNTYYQVGDTTTTTRLSLVAVSANYGVTAYVGLAYDSEMATMPLIDQNSTTGAQAQVKSVSRVTMRCVDTFIASASDIASGIYGAQCSIDGVTWYNFEAPTTGLHTGDFSVDIGAATDKAAVIHIRPSNSMPLTVIAIIAEYTLTGTGTGGAI